MAVTLCVGIHTETLQRFETLERLPMRSHAQRGNENNTLAFVARAGKPVIF